MANAFCTSGKEQLLDNVETHTWKAALYTSKANLDETTEAYTTENEVADGNGYTTGGATLKGATTDSDGCCAWLTFDDIVFPNASFTARYMLVYDADDSNCAYALIDFSSDKTGQGGNFTFRMPAPDAQNALIRL